MSRFRIENESTEGHQCSQRAETSETGECVVRDLGERVVVEVNETQRVGQERQKEMTRMHIDIRASRDRRRRRSGAS